MIHFNWMTAIDGLLIFVSIIIGTMRGFISETIHVTHRLFHIVAAIIGLIVAWMIMQGMSNWINRVSLTAWPAWMIQAVDAWKHYPQIAQIIVFAIGYFVIITLLDGVFSVVPGLLRTVTPSRMHRNRFFGGVVGIANGGIQIVMLTTVIYLVLQFFAFPGLAKVAQASLPYQYLASRWFNPWLQPLINKEMPVLKQDALAPLSKNINLFAVPTGQPGHQRGLLIVPKQIAVLAKHIVAGKTTDEQKAKALYEWEIRHIHYNWAKYRDYVDYGKWDQQSPLQTLQTGRGVCADYALLYADMAHSVGLTVKIDEGIGISGGESGSHAWNEVYDSTTGHWLTVDTTWGSAQDQWFNPPHFFQTHHLQTSILIPGGSH